MTRLMAQAFSGAVFLGGDAWFGLSIFVRFHVVLRTDELLMLTAGQILLSSNSCEAVINRGYNKSSKRKGCHEIVV